MQLDLRSQGGRRGPLGVTHLTGPERGRPGRRHLQLQGVQIHLALGKIAQDILAHVLDARGHHVLWDGQQGARVGILRLPRSLSPSVHGGGPEQNFVGALGLQLLTAECHKMLGRHQHELLVEGHWRALVVRIRVGWEDNTPVCQVPLCQWPQRVHALQLARPRLHHQHRLRSCLSAAQHARCKAARVGNGLHLQGVRQLVHLAALYGAIRVDYCHKARAERGPVRLELSRRREAQRQAQGDGIAAARAHQVGAEYVHARDVVALRVQLPEGALELRTVGGLEDERIVLRWQVALGQLQIAHCPLHLHRPAHPQVPGALGHGAQLGEGVNLSDRLRLVKVLDERQHLLGEWKPRRGQGLVAFHLHIRIVHGWSHRHRREWPAFAGRVSERRAPQTLWEYLTLEDIACELL